MKHDFALGGEPLKIEPYMKTWHTADKTLTKRQKTQHLSGISLGEGEMFQFKLIISERVCRYVAQCKSLYAVDTGMSLHQLRGPGFLWFVYFKFLVYNTSGARLSSDLHFGGPKAYLLQYVETEQNKKGHEEAKRGWSQFNASPLVGWI